MQRNRTFPTSAQPDPQGMYIRSMISAVLFCFEQNSSASSSAPDNNFSSMSEPQSIVLFAATYSPSPTLTTPNIVPTLVVNVVQLCSMTAIQQTKKALDFVIPFIQFPV
jgi:hypothetical protein